jgi:integrase
MAEAIDRTDFLYRKGPYLYFRFPKRFKVKPVGLPTDETSKEFERAYDRCLATLRKMEADADAAAEIKPEPKPLKKSEFGTIAKAIEIYLGSKSFGKLKAATQRIYRKFVLERMKREIGNDPLCQLDRDALEEYVDIIYQEDGSASMADLYVTLASNIWKEVRKDEQFGIRKLANPTTEIERKHKEADAQPHLRWTEDIQERFMATAPAHLRFAKEVLHFTVQRGGDAVRIKWTDYDGRGVKIWPEKTTAKGKVFDPKYHLLPRRLIRLLDAAKETAMSEFVLVHSRGKPWANSHTLSKAITAHFTKIGVRKKGQKSYSMHGLRHTGGSEISMLPGVGVKGIKSGTGHASDKQALHYAEQAEAARINAAMIAAWDDEHERQEAEKAARKSKKRASLKVVK